MNKLVVRLSDGIVVNRVVVALGDFPPAGHEFVNESPGVDIGFVRQNDGTFLNPFPLSPPAISENWAGFGTAFLQDPEWTNRKFDLSEEIRIGVLSTASNRNLGGLAYWYGLAKQFWDMNGKPLPDSVRDRWQKIAIAHNIDFTF